ncbi:MAG: hypothetical protein RLZZ368_1347 [Actinomycetota bacterium]
MWNADVMNPLGRPVQIAYAADPSTTIQEHAADHSTRLGAGPFVIAEHIELGSSRVRGVETPFDHSSAYGWWGDLMLEIVVEHSEPLVPPGRGRLHHVAFMVDSLSKAIDHCAQHGAPVLLHASTKSGTEFVFCDDRDRSGHLIELYERSAQLLAFYDHVRSLAT